jgi:hypothetical protein
MSKYQRKYTATEDQIIIDSVNKMEVVDIAKAVNRTPHSIQERIGRLKKLGKLPNERIDRGNKKSNARVLLEESNLKYYWLGFLLADGHFSKDGHIRLSMSSVDAAHAERYQKFINLDKIKTINYKTGYSTNHPTLLMVTTNKVVCTALTQRHSISNQKTYNPPDVLSFPNEFKLPLYLGFLDGDGSIYQTTVTTKSGEKYTKTVLTLEVRKEWCEFVSDLIVTIGFTVKPQFTKHNTVRFNATNKQKLTLLKRRGMDLGIPLMTRKWDKIQL